MTYAGPILDNHFHIQRTGRFLEAVKAFHAAGGTHVTLIPIPGDRPKRSRAEWREFFDDHLAVADLVERQTPVRVVRAVGPYPVEFHRMALAEGLPVAIDAFRAGYDAAHDALRQGRAVVMGEVGRLHFPVPSEIQDAATRLLAYGLGRARDAGVPAILHTEHATPDVMAALARVADEAGMPRDRVVKHYSGPLVLPEEVHGLVPSIIASKGNLAAAVAKGDRFLMETDYIDDLARPDVVLPPHQVPKRTKALSQQGVPEGSLLRIHKELPERLYGLTLEPPRATS